MSVGSHPIPSRTRKLSLSEPMVLQGQPCGRVGRRRNYGAPFRKKRGFFLLSDYRSFRPLRAVFFVGLRARLLYDARHEATRVDDGWGGHGARSRCNDGDGLPGTGRGREDDHPGRARRSSSGPAGRGDVRDQRMPARWRSLSCGVPTTPRQGRHLDGGLQQGRESNARGLRCSASARGSRFAASALALGGLRRRLRRLRGRMSPSRGPSPRVCRLRGLLPTLRRGLSGHAELEATRHDGSSGGGLRRRDEPRCYGDAARRSRSPLERTECHTLGFPFRRGALRPPVPQVPGAAARAWQHLDTLS